MHGWTNGQRWFGEGADENKYLNAVHDRLGKELPLDPKHQGLVGFSAGGSEAYRLAPLNPWVSSVQTVEGYMTGYEQPLTRPLSRQGIHALHDPVVHFGGTEQVCTQADREAENVMEMSKYAMEPIFDPKMLVHAWACAHEKDGAMVQSQQYIVDAYNRANGLVDPVTGETPAPVVTKSGDIRTRSWLNPANGTENRQVTLSTGTHGWAGSRDHSGDIPIVGIPNGTLNASAEIVRFLKDHSLSEQAPLKAALQ